MSKQLDFFNTVHLSGQELTDAVKTVKNQNERIYQLLKKSGKSLTPFEVHDIYIKIFGDCPVTSIRRAMTTLTNENKLRKDFNQKGEKYGKPNHTWTAL